MSRPKRLEASIEGAVIKYAKRRAEELDLNLEVRKMNGMGARSWPDRMFIFSVPGDKEANYFFIEFKRPGGVLTLLQAKFIERLRDMGVQVWVIDDVEVGKRAIDVEFA